MEQNYNKKLCVNNFKIGDMVLVKELTRSKLDPLFEGPFEVIKSKHPVYTIRNCQDSSDERRIHHNRLFKLKQSTMEPKQRQIRPEPRRSCRIRRPPQDQSEYTRNMIQRGVA
ncbi:hypothetical protein RF11_01703 [Thelohanellus kitauei]|uniref:Uncharacterized protein n=1 Tax=Thelohanellus kitauei TaxID=669202 RepID=A0A0C2N864_THEKT|nr:hypothetical protein RF11_01703 [Thelohanellus kitauei]